MPVSRREFVAAVAATAIARDAVALNAAPLWGGPVIDCHFHLRADPQSNLTHMLWRATLGVTEGRMLFSAFPDLHDAFDPEDLPVWFILKRDAPQNAGKAIRRRKPMSAAGKKAVSRRMKKYWAERRASTKK